MTPSRLAPDDYFPLVEARHCDPFRVLGIRSLQDHFLARVLRPDASEVAVILDSKGAKAQKLLRVDEHGLFEGEIAGFTEGMSYTLEITGHDGRKWKERDAYSFPPVLGEMDIYLFNEGTHYDIYKKLGAHVKVIGDVPGVHFAVWAPSAQRVSVVGDFN
ncbi:MAG: GlgB N-terminal domain-containing protein, partial [Spartobacteria bacterium]